MADKIAKRGISLYIDGNRVISSVKGIKDEMNKLSNEQKKMTIGSDEYVRHAMKIGRLDAILQDHKKYQAQVSNEYQTMGKRADEYDKKKQSAFSFGSLSKGVEDFFNKVKYGAAAVYTAIFGVDRLVNKYAELDEAKSGVRKYAGLTPEEVDLLNNELKKLDTKTTRIELNALVSEAGKLGIEGVQNLLDFAEAGNVIKVSLGEDLGEGAITQIGKLSNMFGDADRMGLKKAMLGVGSAVNSIGQSSSASEPYLVEFLNRMAGIGVQAKLDIPKILGYASVLDQNAQNVEVSATALNGVISKIFQDPGKFAKIAGLNVKEFSLLLKKDANEALLTLLTTLNKKGGFDKLAPMFEEMKLDGVRSSAVLSVLANNVDQVRQEQVNANQAFVDGTSVINEYAIANNTLTSRLQKKKNEFWEMTVELGEKLAPAYLDVMDAGIGFGNMLMIVGRFLLNHTGIIVSVVGALTAYTLATKAWALYQGISNSVMVIAKMVTLSQASAQALATGNTVRAAAAQKLYTAQVASGSVITKAYVAVTSLFSATTALLTGNLKKAKVVMAEFTAVTKLNPWVLLATAVAGAIVGLSMYISKQSKVNELQLAHNRISDKVNEEYGTQEGKLRILINTLNNENIGLDRRREALEAIKRIIPEYHAQLTNEGNLIDNNTASIEDYLIKLEEQIRLEASKEELIALYKKKRQQEQAKKKADEELNAYKSSKGKTTFVGGREGNVMATSGAISLLSLSVAAEKANENLNQTSIALKRVEGEVKAGESKRREKPKQVDKEGDTKFIDGMPYVFKNGKWVAQVSTDLGGGSDKASVERKRVTDAMAKIEEGHAKEMSKIKTDYLNGDIKDEETYNEKILAQQDKYDKERITKLTNLLGSISDASIKTDIGRDIANIQEAGVDRAISNKKKSIKIDNNEADSKLKSLSSDQSSAEVDLSKKYSDGLMNERQYNDSLLLIELAYLQKKMSVEGLTADQSLEIKKQSLEKLRAITENNGDLEAKNNKKKKIESLNDSKNAELELLDSLFDEDLRNEEAYQIARQAIIDKYSKLEQDKNKQKHQNMINATQFALDSIGTLMSSYSNLLQADQDAETAKINQKYDAQVKAAGGSSSAIQSIEEKRQEALNKLNKKATDRSYRLQIAQALASTFQAAINAFSATALIPVLGPGLAPIAAGVATAAGLLQVAAIKKQWDTAKSAYYTGGFTPKGKWDEVQGTVHSDEFVANRFATSNELLRPLFNLVDYAQRNNTVSSLSRKDLANALNISPNGFAVGGYTSKSNSMETSPTPQVLLPIDMMMSVLMSLDNQLRNPIKASVSVTGHDGIKDATDLYDTMIKNISRND